MNPEYIEDFNDHACRVREHMGDHELLKINLDIMEEMHDELERKCESLLGEQTMSVAAVNFNHLNEEQIQQFISRLNEENINGNILPDPWNKLDQIKPKGSQDPELMMKEAEDDIY